MSIKIPETVGGGRLRPTPPLYWTSKLILKCWNTQVRVDLVYQTDLDHYHVASTCPAPV